MRVASGAEILRFALGVMYNLYREVRFILLEIWGQDKSPCLVKRLLNRWIIILDLISDEPLQEVSPTVFNLTTKGHSAAQPSD